MNINLVCPIIVLDNESNSNIRKNDIKTFKILVSKNDKSLVNLKLTEPKDIKTSLKSKIKEIIGSNNFQIGRASCRERVSFAV